MLCRRWVRVLRGDIKLRTPMIYSFLSPTPGNSSILPLVGLGHSESGKRCKTPHRLTGTPPHIGGGAEAFHRGPGPSKSLRPALRSWLRLGAILYLRPAFQFSSADPVVLSATLATPTWSLLTRSRSPKRAEGIPEQDCRSDARVADEKLSYWRRAPALCCR